jgi:aryl-alcohol dehydrogenase-like predicted oxidoreductase
MAPKLPTRELGRGGPQVVALGMSIISMIGGADLTGSDYERFTYLDRAYDLGETNWDSENLNFYYDTENVIGRCTGKRNEIFLATKFGFMEKMNQDRSGDGVYQLRVKFEEITNGSDRFVLPPSRRREDAY